ncbi:hypothetical protein [Luteipulveratus flavus]|uniref:DUF946 domain-containing protein n=1 Tax=Luteipulveratus flavus TaxID=3031728 RepID=A0ABT6C7K2_9MICO|nr:hypothetical protein [Luteipulveratus sp. YIM 133296]MDF8264840.1 hypothetical protein [Luteipulveratus sp. YIM 133296]
MLLRRSVIMVIVLLALVASAPAPATAAAGRVAPARTTLPASPATAPAAAAHPASAPAATAPEDEVRLAQRFAPVLRLVRQDRPCDSGEPYAPADVAAFLDNDTVALRGPWGADDLIKVGPTAQDLAKGLPDYHLDFPGDPLRPGCDYEQWARSVTGGHRPTMYAHVVADRDRPGRLALQYWFFYAFNDFNNTHEGDWELVQLEFDAPDAATAFARTPVRLGYSQHEGVETSAWEDPKLAIVGGTHPVVYPAAGSHASYYEPELYLGRSGQRGFGCDDALGPQDEPDMALQVVPQDPRAAVAAFPWLGFRGRWGERQQAFYNGPTGPNMKDRWTRPADWVDENGHGTSYSVPAGGLFGTQVTDLFCSGVGTGSRVLRRATSSPSTALVLVAIVLVFAVWQTQRTSWEGSRPLRAARRRSWGQTVAAAVRMYAARPVLFTSVGLLTVPLVLLLALLSRADLGGPVIGGGAGDASGGIRLGLTGVLASVEIGVVIVLVQAASTQALAEIDAGRDVTAWSAYRLALAHWRPLLMSCVVWAAAVGLLVLSTRYTVLLAVIVIVLWGLFVPVLILERRGPVESLRRSARLVLPRMLRVISLIAAAVVLAGATGPLIGFALLLLIPSLPFALLNLLSGLVYVVLFPLVALTTAYVYYDAAVNEARTGEGGQDVLPSELPDPDQGARAT